MQIRDLERPFAPRRGREINPLRKTAEGLGVFLSQLSEEVRESAAYDAGADADAVDSAARNHGRNPSRGFKFAGVKPEAASAPAVDFDLNEEETEALDLLKDARNLASNASNAVVSTYEREITQERLQEIFMDLSAKRINILSSMLNEGREDDGSFPFSLATTESARTAYKVIDDLIMKLLGSGVKGDADAAGGADSPYNDHGAALSAAEQLKEFLLNEGPIKAFARFREVNRSSVLGLLQ